MSTKQSHAEWKRKWRKNNPDKVIAAQRRYYQRNKGRDIFRIRNQRVRTKRRQFIIDFFGGRCVRCGFSDPRALQMDHINGRKGITKLGNIDNRYAYVRNNPSEAIKVYQMLCANCNFIKREENLEHFYHGRTPLK